MRVATYPTSPPPAPNSSLHLPQRNQPLPFPKTLSAIHIVVMTNAAYKHHLPPQFLPPIQQVVGQHHACGPELSAAAFFEVFVELEGWVQAG